MAKDLQLVHPELRAVAQKFPPLTFNRWTYRLIRALFFLMPKPPTPADIQVREVRIPGVEAGRRIRLRIYTPAGLTTAAPALVWIHGGGYVIGVPEQNDAYAYQVARETGCVIVAVDYRLAPEHPFPAPLDDCYAALQWTQAQAGRLGIDPARIAVGGDSAGGGLAAAVAQRAYDRGEIRLILQLLIYPMLDDRTVLQPAGPTDDWLTWTRASNRFGWESYLRQPAGAPSTPPHAVPARRADLAGLPPAWVGVGTLDLFHDEDLAYAERLKANGVPCEVVVIPGAFHGFDALNDPVPVVTDFRRSQVRALRQAFYGD